MLADYDNTSVILIGWLLTDRNHKNAGVKRLSQSAHLSWCYHNVIELLLWLWIAAVGNTSKIHNIFAMILLVIYNFNAFSTWTLIFLKTVSLNPSWPFLCRVSMSELRHLNVSDLNLSDKKSFRFGHWFSSIFPKNQLN